MKSIRLSLMVYFLGLLALALGTASLLAYQTSYLTLQEKRAATEKLIDQQYEDRIKDERARFDRRLYDQARTLARLVEFRIELPMPSKERQMQTDLQLLGTLAANQGPALAPHLFIAAGLAPPPPPWRGEWRPDPFGSLFRKSPTIKLNEDEQLAQLARSGSAPTEDLADDAPNDVFTAEYFQVFSPNGGSFKAEKLGDRSLPYDIAALGPNDPRMAYDYNDLMLTPDNLPLRRVILKIPTGMSGPPSPSGPPPHPPHRPGQPPPDRSQSIPLHYDPSRQLYIQCATPLAPLEKKLAKIQEASDGEKIKVRAETTASLQALRDRLIGMSLLTFAVVTFGTWWLVRLGLLPLERLSVAVSKVSEKDFQLHFDEPRLPSELRPIHDRLTDTLEQLQRAFAREKQATADISHELRTPLAALLTTMELALRKTRTAEEYREMFQDCLLSGQHMRHVVERLLALARLDAGSDRLRPVPVNVGQLADQCAAVVRPLAEARGLQLEVRLGDDTQATADPDKVREMMMNLLHNAIQYNQPAGSVTLAVSRPNGHVQIEVSDTGIGIAPENRAQIFERFFRADPSRVADGAHAGLGLAIVKGYVDLMGGSLDVESEVGHGSTFRIGLPA